MLLSDVRVTNKYHSLLPNIDETIVEEAGQGSGDLETPDVISFSRRRLLSHPIQPPAKKLRGNIQI